MTQPTPGGTMKTSAELWAQLRTNKGALSPDLASAYGSGVYARQYRLRYPSKPEGPIYEAWQRGYDDAGPYEQALARERLEAGRAREALLAAPGALSDESLLSHYRDTHRESLGDEILRRMARVRVVGEIRAVLQVTAHAWAKVEAIEKVLAEAAP